MPHEECTEILTGWDGYRVSHVERFKAGRQSPSAEIWVDLLPRPDRVKRCSKCEKPVRHVHDAAERWVRDLPILDATTWIRFPRCRVACPRCGPTLELLPWLDKYARVTTRLADSVGQLCQMASIKHVAEFYGMKWDAVKAIDMRFLQRTLGKPDLSDVEILAIDEFAIQKGHRYATVIIEPNRKQVLWVGRGRSREDIRPFFEMLGPEGRKRIKAVAMDMSRSFEEEVRFQCPDAEIVFDLFHVVAKYGREVINRVRVDEANRVRHDKKARKVIKSSRWLLLRNRSSITKKEDRVRLDELLRANRRLMTVYVLKEDLKQLWKYRSEGWARRAWDDWYHRAIRSRIEPLKAFARKLKPYLPGIFSHCRWPLHTSLLEGINNKIKVIKRMAYGYRDDEYFFLKIRQAFPGNGS